MPWRWMIRPDRPDPVRTLGSVRADAACERLESLQGDLRDAIARLEDVADRLGGPSPTGDPDAPDT